MKFVLATAIALVCTMGTARAQGLPSFPVDLICDSGRYMITVNNDLGRRDSYEAFIYNVGIDLLVENYGVVLLPDSHEGSIQIVDAETKGTKFSLIVKFPEGPGKMAGLIAGFRDSDTLDCRNTEDSPIKSANPQYGEASPSVDSLRALRW